MRDVVRLRDYDWGILRGFFLPQGLAIEEVAYGNAIPGSHWGDEEAGLIQNVLFARSDTPVHSVLHEGCHWLLMDESRRASLHTNAGGTLAEENAVCYLQVLIAQQLPGLGKSRMFEDMDTWGYSFRLGSTQRWFEEDADDALATLHSTLDPQLHKQLHITA